MSPLLIRRGLDYCSVSFVEGGNLSAYSKMGWGGGTWLVQPVECDTLDLRAVSSSLTLGAEITLKKRDGENISNQCIKSVSPQTDAKDDIHTRGFEEFRVLNLFDRTPLRAE